MDLMQLRDISPDQVVFWQWRFVKVNATIVFTWIVMAVMVLGAWLGTRRISADVRFSRRQGFLEVLVSGIRQQIREISHQEPGVYLNFIGTLFLFILVSNLLLVIPGYIAPTGSLSTTAGLAVCVFVAVPLFGILRQGVSSYLRQYLQPTPLMMPFNVMGELSRTLALAVRLFGNIMSGNKIAAILLSLAPLLFPVVMQLLGLLTGVIQAYIFAVLAMVYIASATRARGGRQQSQQNESKGVDDG